mgnify:CR=1 FL=1
MEKQLNVSAIKDGTVIECRIQTPINWYQSSMQRNGDTMTIDPKVVSLALGKNAEGKYHFPQEISYIDRFTGETKNVKINKIASMDREDRKDIYPDEVLAQLAQTGPVLGGDYDSGDHVWNGTATLTTRAGDDVKADGANILTYKANKKPEWAERMLENVPISGSSETRKTLIGKKGQLSAEEMKKVEYYSNPYSQNGGGYAQEMNAWVLWSADGTTALNSGSDNNWDFHYYVDFKNVDWNVVNPRNAGVSPKMVVEIYLSSLTPEQVKAIGEGENPFPVELIEKYSQSDRAVSVPETLQYYLTEVASAVTGNNSSAAPIEVSPNWPEGFADYTNATWTFENKSYEVRYTSKETEYGANEFTAYLKIDNLVYGPISANG